MSLFDDDDDDGALFENDLFSNFSSKSLFDTDLQIGKEKPPDIEPEKEIIHSGDKPKPSALFDDYEDNEDLFSTSVLKSPKFEEDDSRNGRMRPWTDQELLATPVSRVALNAGNDFWQRLICGR